MSARVVCQSVDVLACLPHVAARINAFLDCSGQISLETAITKRLDHLLRRKMDTFIACPSERPLDMSSAIVAAVERNEMEVLELVHSLDASVDVSEAIERAAQRGYLPIVRWFHEHGHVASPWIEAMDPAAANGHLEVLDYLHKHRTGYCSTRAMDMAAQGGHLEIVRFLHKHREEGCTSQAIDWAAAMGHLDVVQWLHAQYNRPCSSFGLHLAVQNNHHQVAAWIQAKVHSILPEIPAE